MVSPVGGGRTVAGGAVCPELIKTLGVAPVLRDNFLSVFFILHAYVPPTKQSHIHSSAKSFH